MFRLRRFKVTKLLSLEELKENIIEVPDWLWEKAQKLATPDKVLFVIKWRGNRVPRRAKLDKKIIAWTQGGVLDLMDAKKAGEYLRLQDPIYEKNGENVMLVFVLKQHLV